MTERSLLLVNTRLGSCGVGFIGGNVGRLWLPGRGDGALAADMKEWAGAEAVFEAEGKHRELMNRITRYFDGKSVDFESVRVVLPGFTGFARDVLTKLRMVKWGRTVTYKEMAAMAGRPGASRAVGMIMSKNPAPLIIPCHRVIRSDGGLGGFSGPGGIELKKTMLRLEGLEAAAAPFVTARAAGNGFLFS